MKYLKLFREWFITRPTFTTSDIRKVLSKTGISNEYLYVLIHNLIKKREMKVIRKGVYTLKEEMTVVGFAFPPFYYGLQEALSLRKLWEQEANSIVITTRKVRSGVRVFLGNNYLVKRIDRKMFFGFEMIKYYDYWLPVSDVEKTLIDFVYFKQRLPKETLNEIKKQIRNDKLKEYLGQVPSWVKKRVLKLLG
ncbi:MAG: hypothetical protein Q7S22_06740 [Candidatus Micrarchaeota archaeon]|nr:hypothetical protein [Candidatus Micrarchaeota archaeon]